MGQHTNTTAENLSSHDSIDVNKKNFPRRTFLQLVATLVGGMALGRLARPVYKLAENVSQSIQESGEKLPDDWMQIDFVDKPEKLFGNELNEAMKQEMVELGKFCNDIWRHEQRSAEKPEEGYINADQWSINASFLVDTCFGLARDVVSSRRQELRNVEPEINRKYIEHASYLRTMLFYSRYYRAMPIEDAYNQILGLNGEYIQSLETGSDKADKALPLELKRLNISSLWNYPWKDMITGADSGTHKLTSAIISEDGKVLIDIPSWATFNLLQMEEKNVDLDPFKLWARPKEMQVINFDAEVGELLSNKLKKVGINRAITSLTWNKHDSSAQGATDPKSNIGIGGGVYELDKSNYQKYSRIYDALAYHEGHHALENRSRMLSGADRLRYRDHMLKIFQRFDPLRSPKHLFNPDGSYPDLSKFDNAQDFYLAELEDLGYMSMTDYNVGILLGGVYGSTVKTNLDELRNAGMAFGSSDLYRGIWPENVSTVEEYLEGLFRNREQLSGVNRLIADVILESKDDILARKRMVFGQAPGLFYITEVVFPLLTSHIAFYRKDELREAFLENIPNKEAGVNYFDNWHMRLTDQVYGIPCEELVSEVFAAMLNDDKKGASTRWKDTMENFKRMLLILKQNGLAYENSEQLV